MSSKLERQPGWFALPEDQKVAAQRASGLTELDALLRILHRRLVRSLRRIPTIQSRDYDTVLANLQVAERLMPPEENAVVHGILWRAVRDLIALRDE